MRFVVYTHDFVALGIQVATSEELSAVRRGQGDTVVLSFMEPMRVNFGLEARVAPDTGIRRLTCMPTVQAIEFADGTQRPMIVAEGLYEHHIPEGNTYQGVADLVWSTMRQRAGGANHQAGMRMQERWESEIQRAVGATPSYFTGSGAASIQSLREMDQANRAMQAEQARLMASRSNAAYWGEGQSYLTPPHLRPGDVLSINRPLRMDAPTLSVGMIDEGTAEAAPAPVEPTRPTE